MTSTVVTGTRLTEVDLAGGEFYINKVGAVHDATSNPFGYGIRLTGQDHFLRIDGRLEATTNAINLTTSDASDTVIRVTSTGTLTSSGQTIGSGLTSLGQTNQRDLTIINDGSMISNGSAVVNLNFVLTELRNGSSGTITGAESAIILGNASTIINDGIITSNGGWAVKSNSASTIRNRVDGEIYHNQDNGTAIEIGGTFGRDGRFYNEGYLFSEIGSGVVSTGGETYNYGTIEAAQTGVRATSSIFGDYVANSGTIEGGTYSIDAIDSGIMRVNNSGTLDGDVRFGGGNDTLRNSGTIEGDIDLGGGNDRLDNRGGTVTDRALSTIDLGAGNDIFLGSTGTRAVVEGGSGNDRFYGGSDRDSFEGGSGDDIFFTGAGIDSARGGEGADRLYGQGTDTNILFGGFDDDIIFGGSGDDIISGGDTSPINPFVGREIEGIDRIYAGDGNDQIHGDGGNDFIYGGEGNDFIIGGYGDDRLYGQNGDDDFLRDFGDDFIVGGAGTDEVSYTGFNTT
ncbi:MAG: calcium-binding protein, partial [Pseudomonadota bacterium]